MTATLDCPHTQPVARQCAGCTQTEDDGTNERWCDGEVTGKVYRDSDGDAGVINGIRHFLAVEDLELTCSCDLTADEEQKITEQLCEHYDEDDGPDPDDLYDRARDARLEAGW